VDVDRRQQLLRLGEGDPVGGAGHRQSVEEDDELDVVGVDPDDGDVVAPSPADVVFLDVDPLSPDASPPVVEAPSLPFVVEALGALVARRSFLAQPEPLKWIVGALNAFFIGPLPQTGQVVGGSAWTPWTTSKRVPQAAQS